ncbi:MAG: hypothetical protein V2B20_18110 [Pseudomonadota bacterium]
MGEKHTPAAEYIGSGQLNLLLDFPNESLKDWLARVDIGSHGGLDGLREDYNPPAPVRITFKMAQKRTLSAT